LIEGKKGGVGLGVALQEPQLSADDLAKITKLQTSRPDALAKAAAATYAQAASELKAVLSPLFPADALDAVARNDRVALMGRPDFALVREEIAAKRADVARIQARARLALSAAEDKFDADVAVLRKQHDGSSELAADDHPVLKQAASLLPDTAETKFFRAVLGELGAQSPDELLAGKAPRLTPQKMLELAKASPSTQEYAQLVRAELSSRSLLLCVCVCVCADDVMCVQIERVIGREGQEKEFEQQIRELKQAFQSFRPFDQMTVEEVFAQHPEWEREFEEELRQHKWNPE
jgi:hypothetical protein